MRPRPGDHAAGVPVRHPERGYAREHGAAGETDRPPGEGRRPRPARRAALALVLLLAAAACGERERRVARLESLDLLALFPRARVAVQPGSSSTRQPVEIRSFDFGPRKERGIMQVPGASVTFTLDLPEQAALRFGFAMPPSCWTRSPDGVGLHIRARRLAAGNEATDRETVEIFRARLDPWSRPGDRRVLAREVDLAPLGGGRWELIFSLDHGPRRNVEWDVGFWTAPRIVYPAGEEVLPPADPRRPNLLLITVDSLRADALPPFGGPIPAAAPQLTRLAARGLIAPEVFTPSTFTNPSYAAILTGRSPAETGAHGEGDRVDPALPTLAGLLSSRGYATAGFTGALRLDRRRLGLASGFDLYDAPLAGKRPAGETVLEARDWLQRRPGHPFFCWVQLSDLTPPLPHLTPGPESYYPGRALDPGGRSVLRSLAFFERRPDLQRAWEEWLGDVVDEAYIAAAYRAAVDEVDRQIGRLLGELDQAGLLDQTLIVVCSNRGLPLGEEGVWADGQGLSAAATRVPLILHFPGRLPAASRLPGPEPCSTLDILPTVLQLLAPDLSEVSSATATEERCDPRPGVATDPAAAVERSRRPAGSSPEAAGDRPPRPCGRDLLAVLYGRDGRARGPLLLEGRRGAGREPDLLALLDGRFKLLASTEALSAEPDAPGIGLRLLDRLADPQEAVDLRAHRLHAGRLRRMLLELRGRAAAAESPQPREPEGRQHPGP